MAKYATKEEQQAFIDKAWNAIQGIDMGGLFPSVLIAQAAVESSWGKSDLSSKYNNYFGIKKHNWTGKTVKMWTTEVQNGKTVKVLADFRVYDSMLDSIKDRNKFLRENKRYETNGVFDAKTPQEQVEAFKRAKYATGENYVTAIMNTIKANGLTKYDELKKKVGTIKKLGVVSTKTISIIITVIGVALVAIATYNFIKLRK